MEDIIGIVATEDAEMRFHEVIKEGQIVPQGDVYLVRVADLEGGLKALEKELQAEWGSEFVMAPLGPETNNLQLAPGETMGSNHRIREEDRSIVTIYRPHHDATPLEGPTIVASSRFVVTHPTHAHHSCPEGVYKVIYQRDFGTNQLARVED